LLLPDWSLLARYRYFLLGEALPWVARGTPVEFRPPILEITI